MFEKPNGIECHGFPGPGVAPEHIYTMNPAKEFIQGHTDHVDETFKGWSKLHDKKYGDAKEASIRKDVYRQNMRYIHSKNRQHLSYKLASNNLADLTSSEMRFRRGKLKSTGYNGGLPFKYSASELRNAPTALGGYLFI